MLAASWSRPTRLVYSSEQTFFSGIDHVGRHVSTERAYQVMVVNLASIISTIIIGRVYCVDAKFVNLWMCLVGGSLQWACLFVLDLRILIRVGQVNQPRSYVRSLSKMQIGKNYASLDLRKSLSNLHWSLEQFPMRVASTPTKANHRSSEVSFDVAMAFLHRSRRRSFVWLDLGPNISGFEVSVEVCALDARNHSTWMDFVTYQRPTWNIHQL